MENTKKNFSWSLNEIILVSMICIVFGVVYLGAVYLMSVVESALAFTGLTKLGTEVIFGIWFMAATLAGYILQKPGVAIIAETIASVIEVLLGNWFGPMVIVTGIVQGLGAEAVFAAGRYKKFQGPIMYFAAIGCTVTSFLWSFVRSGYLQFQLWVILVYFVVRVISSCLFAGLICKKIGDGLKSTGLLKAYELGKNDN